MTSDVLTRALAEDNFSPVELLDPNLAALQNAGGNLQDSAYFFDLDAEESVDLIASLPVDANIIEFGAHESAQKSTKASRLYLRKPFDKLQIQKALQGSLLANIRLPLAAASSATSNDNLKRKWQRCLESISVRHKQLAQMLTATPDQLRMMLNQRAVDLNANPPPLPMAALPIHHALIIEPSEQNARQMMHHLAGKCVMQADFAPDGANGWDMLESGPYDVVVLRWEMSDINGLTLYNRIRMAERLRYAPVVVLSAKLQSQDFRLLDEDLAVALIALPMQEKTVGQALAKVISNAALSREFLAPLVTLVHEIRQGAVFNKEDWAPKERDYLDLVTNALRVVGEQFLVAQDFKSAEWAFATAWRLGDRRLSLVTGYGKACLRQGKNDLARRLLAAADALAPKSVERLCLLGELELEAHNPGDAKAFFEKASVIDPANKKAISGRRIADAFANVGVDALAQAPVNNFVSYLNLVGVNLARSGDTDEAQNYYQAAMHFVYDQAHAAKLWFNLGICHLRARQQSDARAAFRQAYDISGGTMIKAAKYLDDELPEQLQRASLDYELL